MTDKVYQTYAQSTESGAAGAAAAVTVAACGFEATSMPWIAHCVVEKTVLGRIAGGDAVRGPALETAFLKS